MTPIELISTFRRKISIHTALLHLGIAVLMILTLIIDLEGFLYPDLRVTICLILLALGFYFYSRFREFQTILKGHPEEALSALQKSLHKKQEDWSKHDITRFIIGAIIMALMLTLLFTIPYNSWTGIVIVLWIAFLSGCMMHGWILMKDLMMAQDIKKCIREHHSDISD